MNASNRGENAHSFSAWNRECFLLSAASVIFASKSGKGLHAGIVKTSLLCPVFTLRSGLSGGFPHGKRSLQLIIFTF